MARGTGGMISSAFAWALGAGVGTALGSWLTAVGQAGAEASMGAPGSELFLLPAAAFTAVFFGALAIIAVARDLRRRRRVTLPGPESSSLSPDGDAV